MDICISNPFRDRGTPYFCVLSMEQLLVVQRTGPQPLTSPPTRLSNLVC